MEAVNILLLFVYMQFNMSYACFLFSKCLLLQLVSIHLLIQYNIFFLGEDITPSLSHISNDHTYALLKPDESGKDFYFM